MKYWISLFSLLLLPVFNIFGQCDISAKREVCMNDLVPFVFNLSSGTATSYDWDFGAFGISSNASPLMQFTSAGSLVVRCTATLTTGQKCIDSHALEILPLPKA